MKPGEMSYSDLKAAMKNHLTPPPSEIVQRFKFNSRFRRPGESVIKFCGGAKSIS